ncbi:MAG: aminotransferase class III-fold pyridoxal phosphate-dependent enzyme, partial [Candidatus Omnitrophica bacterium]|nr:aminotransferase class III-fold pyridoxal phosphate-dependent enzyme [Candidatus Omnitrophota bacterium]
MEKTAKPKLRTSKKEIPHDKLMELESKYCSWGDTVHYAEKLNIFKEAKGSFLYDNEGVEYLDLQMWYSAANFGYRNQRLNAVLKKQIDTLPQLACQYLHEEKIRLAAKISQRNEITFEEKGRVHFN